MLSERRSSTRTGKQAARRPVARARCVQASHETILSLLARACSRRDSNRVASLKERNPRPLDDVLAVIQDGWKNVEVARHMRVARQSVHNRISRDEQGGWRRWRMLSSIRVSSSPDRS